jgi:1-acyl-sn-glycerol-3-phosphate acyltransferase
MQRWQLRPAADLDLPMAARLTSPLRETGLAALAGRLFWRALCHRYLCARHRLTVAGAEHLPAAPPFVMVANHASHLDSLVLADCLPLRLADRVFPLAAGDHFFADPARAAFTAMALNALPLARRGARPRQLAALRRRLTEDGCAYILFPEGTRARDGVIAPFRAGLGRLVAGTPVPVVPCHIEGAYAAWPASAPLPRRRPIAVAIGKPMTFAAVADDKDGWRRIAAAAEAAVRSLAAGAAAPSSGAGPRA